LEGDKGILEGDKSKYYVCKYDNNKKPDFISITKSNVTTDEKVFLFNNNYHFYLTVYQFQDKIDFSYKCSGFD
jgi:hypothetical protein